MGIISNFEAIKAELHPTLRAALAELDEGRAVGVRYDLMAGVAMPDGSVLRVEKAFRSVTDQEFIYQNQDRSNPVTLVRGGKSYHQWGLACDLVFRVPGWDSAMVLGVEKEFSAPATWKLFGLDTWYRSKGLTWGGTWDSPVDPGHVELRIPHPSDTALCGTAWWGEDGSGQGAAKGGSVFKWIPWVVLAALALVAWRMTRPVVSGPNIRLAGGGTGPRPV